MLSWNRKQVIDQSHSAEFFTVMSLVTLQETDFLVFVFYYSFDLSNVYSYLCKETIKIQVQIS